MLYKRIFLFASLIGILSAANALPVEVGGDVVSTNSQPVIPVRHNLAERSSKVDELDQYGFPLKRRGAADPTPEQADEWVVTSGLAIKLSTNPADWPNPTSLISVVKPAPNKAFFWTGTVNGVQVERQAEVRELKSFPHCISYTDYLIHSKALAARAGGTTLAMLLVAKGITMPVYDIKDKRTTAIWEKVSEMFASQASGTVTAVVGTTRMSLIHL